MAADDIRYSRDKEPYYTAESPPAGIDPVVAEWCQRQFQRIADVTKDKLGLVGSQHYWYDALGTLTAGKAAANSPTWEDVGGTLSGLYAWDFDRGDALQIAYHINHDIDMNPRNPDGTVSGIYPHVHWFEDSGAAGNVVWKFTYTVAKGHNQEAFAAPTSVSVTQAASGTAYQHMIAEVADGDVIPMTSIEVDACILMTIERGSAGDGDTFGTGTNDGVYAFFADLHYQRGSVGTPNKSPNFWK